MLRPLKLVHLNVEQLEASTAKREDGNVRDVQDGEEAEDLVETLDIVPGEMRTTSIPVAEAEIPLGEAGARYLLKRTPSSYLLNQGYGLWVFASFSSSR